MEDLIWILGVPVLVTCIAGCFLFFAIANYRREYIAGLFNIIEELAMENIILEGACIDDAAKERIKFLAAKMKPQDEEDKLWYNLLGLLKEKNDEIQRLRKTSE